MTTGGAPWRVERQCGPAGPLHARSAHLVAAEGGPARRVRILKVDRPALILGSGQPESDVDLRAAGGAGVDVVRRRSGGGAVLVDRDAVLWIDLIIPAGDELWDADVGRAMWWVGDLWADTLEAVGVGPARVWRAGMRPSPWSGRVCFAGVGPGEVRIGSKKVVGVSQRRTRRAALFQTAALLTWDPVALLALLRADDAERAHGAADLQHVATGVGPDRAGALVDSLVGALSRSRI